jgi:multidrug efflux pump subunit AcrB
MTEFRVASLWEEKQEPTHAIVLWSPGTSGEELDRTAKDLARRLGRRAYEVRVFGTGTREHHIEVDPRRLESHSLSIQDIRRAVQRQSRHPGDGVSRSQREDNLSRSSGLPLYQRLEGTVISQRDDGSVTALRDIANVNSVYVPGPTRGYRDSNPAVLLIVRGTKDAVPELNDDALPESINHVVISLEQRQSVVATTFLPPGIPPDDATSYQLGILPLREKLKRKRILH